MQLYQTVSIFFKALPIGRDANCAAVDWHPTKTINKYKFHANISNLSFRIRDGTTWWMPILYLLVNSALKITQRGLRVCTRIYTLYLIYQRFQHRYFPILLSIFKLGSAVLQKFWYEYTSELKKIFL